MPKPNYSDRRDGTEYNISVIVSKSEDIKIESFAFLGGASRVEKHTNHVFRTLVKSA